jgi:excisionase family DNA binding protein
VQRRRLLTVPEVAEEMRVTEETVRRWLRSGHIKGTRIGAARAGWRIPEDEIERLMADGVETEEVKTAA